jgi:predicted nucleotide-binding protein
MLFAGFGEFLPDEYPYDVPGASRCVKKCDFDNMVSVLPVADPNIFSAAQRIALAQTQLQLAQSAPNMHNMYEAYYRVYAALNVRDIDGILKVQTNQMPKDPASENIDAVDNKQLKVFAGQQHDAHIASHLMMGMSPLIQANPLAASELQKHVLDHIKIKAEEDAEAELFAQYGVDPDKMISSMQREALVALKVAQYMMEVKQLQNELSGQGQAPVDPVVQLKQQELQQRAAKDAQDAQLKQQALANEQMRIQENAQANDARIESQEKIAAQRTEARERIYAPRG